MDITEDVSKLIEELEEIQDKINEMTRNEAILTQTLEKKQEEFNSKFGEDKPYNPVYIDRKNEQQKKIEEYKKQVEEIGKEKQKSENELKEQLDLRKEGILEKIRNRRDFLTEAYNNKKNNINMDENIKQLEEQKKQLENDIEHLKNGIKSETINAENSGYRATLETMEKWQEENYDKLGKINSKLETYNEMSKIDDFEKEFDKLGKVESALNKPYKPSAIISELKALDFGEKKIEEKVRDEEKDKEESNIFMGEKTNVNDPEKSDYNIIYTEKEDDKGKTDVDLKFKKNNLNLKHKMAELRDISMKIDEKGHPEYTFELANGKKYGPIYISEIKKYSKLSKKIEEDLKNENIDAKQLDPFLMNIMKKLHFTYKNAAEMILGKEINLKYDMKNLKKIPNLLSRYRYRKIARAAEKNGIEVENLEDSLFERARKWVKKIGEKEPKRLGTGNNIKDKISNKLDELEINSYFRTKDKTDKTEKTEKKFYKIVDKINTEQEINSKSYEDLSNNDIQGKKSDENVEIEYDKLGNRTTKTEDDLNREKLEDIKDEKAKEISAEILKNLKEKSNSEIGE